MTRPIHIVGVGSLGSFLAERFRDAGFAVTLIRRGEAPPISAEALILIAVKAYDLRGAADLLRARLSGGETVVVLSNGLGLLEEIGAPREWIRGLAWFGVARGEDGGVRFAGEAPLELAGGEASVRESVAQDFARAGFTQARALNLSVEEAEWRKALLNLALNGIAARERILNGAALERPELEREARALTEEAVRVARARGIDLGSEDQAWARVRAGLEATRSNRCSTLQDVEAGRPTEIPWLNGRLAAWGQALSIPVPTHQALADRFRSPQID